MKEFKHNLMVVCSLAVGFLLAGGLFHGFTQLYFTQVELRHLRKQAVEKGFAEFNPTNGVWQWKEME